MEDEKSNPNIRRRPIKKTLLLHFQFRLFIDACMSSKCLQATSLLCSICVDGCPVHACMHAYNRRSERLADCCSSCCSSPRSRNQPSRARQKRSSMHACCRSQDFMLMIVLAPVLSGYDRFRRPKQQGQKQNRQYVRVGTYGLKDGIFSRNKFLLHVYDFARVVTWNSAGQFSCLF